MWVTQDHRSSWKDRTNNSMTIYDGERINPYSENQNDPDGLLPVSHWIYTMEVTGILRFVNQTPLHRYSKKQATPETATHGVEQLSVDTNDHVHIHDNSRPADILSSHWSYRNVWNMLRSILFWHDNTEDFHRTVGECQLCTHSMYFYVVDEYCILVYVRCT